MSGLPIIGTQGKFTWRMLATVLVGQSIVIFFGALVARGTAIAAGGQGGSLLAWGSALAIFALVAAGLLRGPLGLPLGWLVQLLTWASAVVVTAMIGVGLIFTSLWVLCLVQGRRVDAMMAAREQTADDAT